MRRIPSPALLGTSLLHEAASWRTRRAAPPFRAAGAQSSPPPRSAPPAHCAPASKPWRSSGRLSSGLALSAGAASRVVASRRSNPWLTGAYAPTRATPVDLGEQQRSFGGRGVQGGLGHGSESPGRDDPRGQPKWTATALRALRVGFCLSGWVLSIRLGPPALTAGPERCGPMRASWGTLGGAGRRGDRRLRCADHGLQGSSLRCRRCGVGARPGRRDGEEK